MIRMSIDREPQPAEAYKRQGSELLRVFYGDTCVCRIERYTAMINFGGFGGPFRFGIGYLPALSAALIIFTAARISNGS
jgi:hypothetical protein